MAERELVYEVIDHADGDSVYGKVWWDGKKVQSDEPSLLKLLKRKAEHTGNASFQDREFLEELPQLFKTGYMTAKRVEDDKKTQ